MKPKRRHIFVQESYWAATTSSYNTSTLEKTII